MIKLFLNSYNKDKETVFSLYKSDQKITYSFKNIDELILFLKSVLRNNNDVIIGVGNEIEIPDNHFSFSKNRLIIKKSLKNHLGKYSTFLKEIFNI